MNYFCVGMEESNMKAKINLVDECSEVCWSVWKNCMVRFVRLGTQNEAILWR